MQVIDKTQPNYKTHKFSFDKQNRYMKICKKCKYKIYKVQELEGSVWVENIRNTINEITILVMNQELSKMVGN